MKICGVVLLFAVAFAKHEHYQGWKSFYVKPSSHEQLTLLGSLIHAYELDFIRYATISTEGVVLVQPEHQKDFLRAMEEHKIEIRVHAADVKEALEYDDIAIEATRNATRTSNRIDILYDNYQPLEVYDEFLDDIAARYPNLVTLVSPANSFEGHPIKYVKISSTNFEDESKPVIVIDAAMHAREWITPPTVAYAISRLVEGDEPDLLDRFDWILIPIANPDGYRFTFDERRFWRKTRSTDSSIISSTCPGVDINRNFDFVWNTVGTSSIPCADDYGGSRAFSEVETRVLRDILHENLHRIAMYLSMHSFGSMILYSWSHDGTLSNNALALHTVGITMADAIFDEALPHFPRYQVGNTVHVIGYAAAGGSHDYAHSIGVPLSFTYELPGLQSGFNGFHLNPRYIRQVCVETWLGIAAGARIAGDFFVPLP